MLFCQRILVIPKYEESHKLSRLYDFSFVEMTKKENKYVILPHGSTISRTHTSAET
jgi:hypothetical protein